MRSKPLISTSTGFDLNFVIVFPYDSYCCCTHVLTFKNAIIAVIYSRKHIHSFGAAGQKTLILR